MWYTTNDQLLNTCMNAFSTKGTVELIVKWRSKEGRSQKHVLHMLQRIEDQFGGKKQIPIHTIDQIWTGKYKNDWLIKSCAMQLLTSYSIRIVLSTKGTVELIGKWRPKKVEAKCTHYICNKGLKNDVCLKISNLCSENVV